MSIIIISAIMLGLALYAKAQDGNGPSAGVKGMIAYFLVGVLGIVDIVMIALALAR